MKMKLIATIISLMLAGGIGVTVYKSNDNVQEPAQNEIVENIADEGTENSQNQAEDNIEDSANNPLIENISNADVKNEDKPQENTNEAAVEKETESNEVSIENNEVTTLRKPSNNGCQNRPNNGNNNNNGNVNNANNNSSTENNDSKNFMAQVEQAIYEKVNEERAKNGLSALNYNNTMQKYARIKSQDMGDNNYFSHEDKNGNLITVKMKQDGVNYRAWGENIAYIGGVSDANALAAQFMNNWMNSSGHRANILSSNYSDIGVGVYKIGNKVYATQEFYK